MSMAKWFIRYRIGLLGWLVARLILSRLNGSGYWHFYA